MNQRNKIDMKIPIFHKSSYAWSLNDYKKSFKLLDEYLKSDLKEEVFSIDDDFFEKSTTSYWQFLHGLTSNSNRRNSFCATLSSLWKDFPSYDVLRLLLLKDFSEPSMVKALGMEDYGFDDPKEDFEQILVAFRTSAHQGFLTNLPELGSVHGRVYLDFEYIKEGLDDSKWLNYKQLLLDFEKELKILEPISWDKMVAANHQMLLSIFLHQAFGAFKVDPSENYNIIRGCLESNSSRKKSIEASIEMVLHDSTDNQLNELVNAACQIQSNKLSGRNWLLTYLDYSSKFGQKTFLKLY